MLRLNYLCLMNAAHVYYCSSSAQGRGKTSNHHQYFIYMFNLVINYYNNFQLLVHHIPTAKVFEGHVPCPVLSTANIFEFERNLSPTQEFGPEMGQNMSKLVPQHLLASLLELSASLHEILRIYYAFWEAEALIIWSCFIITETEKVICPCIRWFVSNYHSFLLIEKLIKIPQNLSRILLRIKF